MSEPVVRHEDVILPEDPIPGKPLGRHIEFDRASKAFHLRAPDNSVLKTKHWTRFTPPFQQGDVGSCVGNGTVGALATKPNRTVGKKYTEDMALAIYGRATTLDQIDGTWPGQDTGSTVLAGAKAAVDLGWATSYHWCFGIDDALHALSNVGPLVVGVTWWSGFDNPAPDGLVTATGSERGGHCFEVLGIDVKTQRVHAENSWGSGWGVKGRFCFSFEDFAKLLSSSGEATLLVV